MTKHHVLGSRGRIALTTMLALIALGPGSSTARSRLAQPHAASPPLRAIFYTAAPAGPKGTIRARPAPSGPTGIKSHLAALKWAQADAAIVPWALPGTAADRRLRAVLAAIVSARVHVRAAALINHPSGSEVGQVRALAGSRALSAGYLRVGSKPALFVAPADRSLRGCAAALRWRAAARSFWLAQATFPGYARCRTAADAWFRDVADARSSRTGGTFLVRPGFWPAGSSAPALSRSVVTWQRAVTRMNTSGARLQIVDSLDDWARGTAIEASAQWPSASGFGTYLDALHAQPPGVRLTLAPPVVEAVSISGVSAHQASLTATVSAGGAGVGLSVEYGPTTAYGRATAPLSLKVPVVHQTVTVVIPGLSAATPYHARVALTSAAGSAVSTDAVFTTLVDDGNVRLAAAGDIACDPDSSEFNGGAGFPTDCQQMAVSSAILAGNYDAVLPLGDEQYNSGTASAFAASYNPSWGRLKAISHPVVGNHEYGSPGAAPYFKYFGAAAGEAGKGWYSYELGSWHVIALNSNCAQVSGCGVGSPQEVWLRQDLAAHPARCTLAYWHHARFSSGQEGDAGSMETIWDDLFDAGADIVLTGHDHDYERFAPQNGDEAADAVNGVREFVVGTGGKNHMTFKTIEAHSEVHDTTTFGFLDLTLGNGQYSWRFVPVPPGGFSDSGSDSCH